MIRGAALLLLLLAVLAVVACAPGGPASTGTPPQDGALTGTVTVLAAASLRDALDEILAGVRRDHPGLTVDVAYAGSQVLRSQVQQGVPFDAIALADEVQMAPLAGAGLVQAPRVFATNELVVVLPPGNRAGVATLADLARPGLRLVLAGSTVPAGAYSREVLDAAAASGGFPADFRERVLANVVSEEENVRQVLLRVQLGEADAGIVYRTDLTEEARRAGVSVVEIPPALNVVARYPLALAARPVNPAAAQAVLNAITGPAGQAILARSGFGPPP